jgi:DNA-binding transcriptional LysR family regulator
MTLDLRELTAFLAVCELGSLGRAAQRLNITQPALSRTIKRLETRLHAPLFERYPTGMVLTAYGEALRPHANLLQRESELATEEIHALRGLAKGTIRVGASASVASAVLPRSIQRVLTHWPNLRVRIVEGVGDVLTDALVKHEIDLAIGSALPDHDEICAVPEFEWQDRSCVVASPKHPLMKRRGLRLQDTLDHQWAMSARGTPPYDELQRLFMAQGLAMPAIVAETRSIIALKSLVAHAGLLSWMAEPMFEPERAAAPVDLSTARRSDAGASRQAARGTAVRHGEPLGRSAAALRAFAPEPPRRAMRTPEVASKRG